MGQRITHKTGWILPAVICLFLTAAIAAPAAERQVLTPTLYSMDFYGFIDGARVGEELTVYDRQGVLCGRFIIDKEGQYGFLHVYGDDRTTTVKEGANQNEPLAFYLNGNLLMPISNQEVIWLGDGQKQQVDFMRR